MPIPCEIEKILNELNAISTATQRSSTRSPLQQALSLLVRRERSRKELTQKLRARGVASTEIDSAIERLCQQGLQSDARFAELLVRTRVNAGYGRLRIHAELVTHGLDRAVIDAALMPYEDEWAQIAGNLLHRRFRPNGPADAVQRRKAADLLIRRGFDADTIRVVLRS